LGRTYTNPVIIACTRDGLFIGHSNSRTSVTPIIAEEHGREIVSRDDLVAHRLLFGGIWETQTASQDANDGKDEKKHLEDSEMEAF
jgi:sugar lactone lactonase YvrE